jgi:hypothetical protein
MMARLHSLGVVPAQAGIHTPCDRILAAGADAFLILGCQGLWVPAFAGTTMEENS